jgi:hypothetical protein
MRHEFTWDQRQSSGSPIYQCSGSRNMRLVGNSVLGRDDSHSYKVGRKSSLHLDQICYYKVYGCTNSAKPVAPYNARLNPQGALPARSSGIMRP